MTFSSALRPIPRGERCITMSTAFLHTNRAPGAARMILKAVAALAGFLISAALALYLYISWGLPSVSALKTAEGLTPLVAHGGEPAPRAALLPLGDIPPHVVNAFLAAHDPDFADRGILDGGIFVYSLSKRVLIARGEKFGHMQDAVLQLNMGLFLTRDEILGAWLATAYFGNSTFGISAAARKYYGKPLAELSLCEAAMLAPIPAAPSFNPIARPGQARERGQAVLGRMVKHGWASKAEADACK